MDWIFDNLQVVFALVLLVAYALRGISRRAAPVEPEEENEERSFPLAEQKPAADPAADARTRQIQEEIRRRILARQRGQQPPQSPSPVLTPPVPKPPEIRRTETLRREQPAHFRPEAPPRTPPPLAPAEAAVLERQRALQERLGALRAERQSAAAGPPPLMPTRVLRKTRKPRAKRKGVSDIRSDLQHPDSVRRAILLREILGLPQGLQHSQPELPRR